MSALATLDQLRAAHAAWIAKWKAEGKPVRAYTTPCCHKRVETPAPTTKGEKWDSLTTCPHCGGLHFKVVTSTSVRAKPVSAGGAK